MTMQDMSLENFAKALASDAPAPGGGGASAAAAALGAALAGMVCSFTVGKKKYAAVENDIRAIQTEAEMLREKLLALVQADADAFEPLSRAYAMEKNDPARDEVMEKCLHAAAEVPMEILRLSCRAIELHEQLLEKGSAMLVSDVGTGAVLCWSAMYGAALNVRVNTKLMKDGAYASALNTEAAELMEKYWKIADRVYESVFSRFERE